MTDRAGMAARTSAWLAAATLVVLGSHVLVYALAPHPGLIGTKLEYEAGGPRLVVLTLLALAVAGALAAVAIWVASVGIAERARLEPRTVAIPQISALRVGVHAVALWCATCLAFALLESFLHWRAGLGWHGIHCLVGPVHRNAVPILAALSLVASALVAVVTHLAAWAHRVVAALRSRPSLPRRSTASPPRPGASPRLRSRCSETGLGPRAPPRLVPALARRPGAPSVHSTRKGSDMTGARIPRVVLAAVAAGAAALIVTSGAWAHAELSPAVAKAKAGQVFTLAVPTEEDGATTTTIELTPPSGFAIDSFAPSPGWTRKLQQTGSGEEAVIQKVTWSGGNVPTGEDSIFQFLASPNASKTYTFRVRQTYSSGKVVDWAGPESSDTPAPTIETKTTLGGSGTSIVAIVALVVGALGLVVGVLALVGGKRSLT